MVFPVAGQKSNHVGQTLSSLMLDVCQLLGVRKLNTTAYHGGKVQPNPKTMLRKQAATYGLQWDKFLSGVVWAYRNTPHLVPTIRYRLP